jgi:hypothetical protein
VANMIKPMQNHLIILEYRKTYSPSAVFIAFEFFATLKSSPNTIVTTTAIIILLKIYLFGLTQPAAAEKPRSGFEVQRPTGAMLTGLVISICYHVKSRSYVFYHFYLLSKDR